MKLTSKNQYVHTRVYSRCNMYIDAKTIFTKKYIYSKENANRRDSGKDGRVLGYFFFQREIRLLQSQEATVW